MESSEREGNATPENRLQQDAAASGSFSPGTSFKKVAAVHRRGPGSIANLSIYAMGISGLWTALGTPLLPIKVEEVIGGGGSSVLGFMFDENDKNGALGIVSLTGLAIAALLQPIAGILSDRRSGPTKRLPFLLVGALGMAASVLFLGFIGTLATLIILNVMIQAFGNFGQGAANGLIADHVSPGNKGAAAGALNLSRVVGAGTLTAIVLLLMSQYDKDTAPGWLTASLIIVAIASVGTTLWTVTALRRAPGTEYGAKAEVTQGFLVDDGNAVTRTDAVPHFNDEAETSTQTGYLRFLIALTFVITGFSALQLYSFFYLQDVVGLANPSQGAVVILLTTATATALTVLPAGRLTDRVGRDPMLYTAGALGVLATIVLIFAKSIIVVAIDGLLIGVTIGIFLTVSWALANDLVSKRNAARDLGYASVAVLIGSASSRISGIGVDRLNDLQHALGYQVVLGVVAFCFVITVALMTKLDGSGPVRTPEIVPDHAATD